MIDMKRGRRKRKKKRGKEREKGHMFLDHFPSSGWLSEAARVSAGLQ